MIITLAPCPTGWGFEPQDSVEIGKLAVKTGMWPLKEYEGGEVSHTRIHRDRLPVEDYLRRQGRFSHLFQPQRNDALLTEIQERVDLYWEGVG